MSFGQGWDCVRNCSTNQDILAPEHRVFTLKHATSSDRLTIKSTAELKHHTKMHASLKGKSTMWGGILKAKLSYIKAVVSRSDHEMVAYSVSRSVAILTQGHNPRKSRRKCIP